MSRPTEQPGTPRPGTAGPPGAGAAGSGGPAGQATPGAPAPLALALRPAEPTDLEALRRQWVDAQWVRPDDTTVETELEAFDVWVAEHDGEVVAGVFVAPFRQRIGGATFTMAGVRGVTCALHMRRRGIVDRLFRHVLHELRGRYELSCLYPFSPPFYEKFDYGTCEHVVSWRLLIEDLDLPVPDALPRCLGRDDIPALIELVERDLPAIGNGAVHPDRYWIEREYFPRTAKDSSPITFGWFAEDGRRLEAALCWRPLKVAAQWGKNGITVRQVHGVDDAWRRRALGYLRALGDQFVELVVHGPPGDLIYHRIRKPYRWDSTVRRDEQQQQSTFYATYWQARFIDPAAALSRPRQLHGPGGTIDVELSDRVFEALNGRFRWTLSESAPAWEALPADARRPGDAAPGDARPSLRIAMGDLARLWYGGVGVHELRRAGRIECDDAAAAILHAALGGFRCYMQIAF